MTTFAQNATPQRITRNFLDIRSFWREYPDRDIEFVRWYPCDVRSLTAEEMYARPETTPSTPSFYMHIPFCNQVCTCCPYNKFHTRGSLVADYITALKNEMDTYAGLPHLRGIKFASGYLGGGTPTTLTAEQLDDLLTHFHSRFETTDSFSITVESTPVDIDEEKLDVLRKHGVNRVSLGVQTFNDQLLRHIGRARAHTGESAIATIEMLERKQVENVCIDFMIGMPGQTQDLWEQDIQTLMDLPVTSFSVYNYAVLPGSQVFYNLQSGLAPACPDTHEADQMYRYMHDKLLRNQYLALTYNDFVEPMKPEWAERGAQTYEVAKVDGHSYRGIDADTFHLTDHIAQNWQRCGEMVAFGSGAYGYLNNHVYLNEPNLHAYMKYCTEQRSIPVRMGAYTDAHERRCRSLVLGLKLLRVKRAGFKAQHGVDLYDYFQEQIDSLVDLGLLALDDEALQVTYPKGWHYIDNISKSFYSKANRYLPQPTSNSTEVLNWQTARPNVRKGVRNG